MQTLRVTLEPLTAFASELKADSLFGQLCWMIVESFGEQRLNQLLDGYLSDAPFLVCSDGFFPGYIPRPDYPLSYFNKVDTDDLKKIKKRQWMPVSQLHLPIQDWLRACKTQKDLKAVLSVTSQPHNSINRLTGTTGDAEFAPYLSDQIWHDHKFEVWFVLDQDQFSIEELTTVLKILGQTGYGRDASIGLGKFSVSEIQRDNLYQDDSANTCITLAPSVISDQGFDASHSYYSVFTRFGRHGMQAIAKAKPYKNPIVMANTSAVLASANLSANAYIGKGIGGMNADGKGRLSKAIPSTVHQGYAPCIKILDKILSL